jgi:hypothetical protein
VVIGAQAIYLHTGAADVALAEATKDSDLAVDPRALGDDPLIEAAMVGAKFHRDVLNPQPGSWWLSADGIPVDLMVPEALAGKGGRRGARIPPYSRHAARRAPGLEAAIVDNAPMTIRALDPSDHRQATVAVAGPAALLVAKLHKIGERTDRPNRLIDKDATTSTASSSRPITSRPRRGLVSWPATSCAARRRAPRSTTCASCSPVRLPWVRRWQAARNDSLATPWWSGHRRAVLAGDLIAAIDD